MNGLKINPADKELWIAALESGQYPQARQALYDDKGYCCLGLFAKVKGCNFFKEIGTRRDEEGDAIEVEADEYTVTTSDNEGYDINDSELLEQRFADKAGITHTHQKLLIHLNDGMDIAVLPSEPIHAVCEALGFEQRPNPAIPGYTEFVVGHKHSFAEISKIIREHF